MTIFLVVGITTLCGVLLMFQHIRRTHSHLLSATDKTPHSSLGSSRRTRDLPGATVAFETGSECQAPGVAAKQMGSASVSGSCTTSPARRCAAHARSAVPLAGRASRTASRSGGHEDHLKSRRTAAVGLRASERHLPNEPLPGMLAFLPCAAVLLDSHRHIVSANEIAAKLFGYSPGEIIGASSDLLIPGLQGLPQLQFDATGLAPARPPDPTAGTQDRVARRKDGAEFPVEITLNAMRSRDERCILFIVDRTERCELQRNRQQLAHLTRVSALGELAGSLAHELNQPLTAILSNAQAAQRFMATRPINLVEVQEILRDLVEDNRRASEVIRKIRALAKKEELEAAPLGIASVIEDVALLVHSDAIIRGIRVCVNVAPGLPAVHGDKVQLQQVVLNLLLNAFDASECRPAQDRIVVVKATHDGKGSACITVSDRGRGVADDMFDKLFAPFVTSKRDGLGLGLSISRSIVDMHGGRIWAENNRDQGATFYVTLPATATVKGASRREQP